jgi:hypothetical protein
MLTQFIFNFFFFFCISYSFCALLKAKQDGSCSSVSLGEKNIYNCIEMSHMEIFMVFLNNLLGWIKF